MTINIGANIRINKLGLCLFIIFLIILYLYAIRESPYLAKNNNRDFVSLKKLLATSIRAAELGGLEIVNVYKKSKVSVTIKGKTKENVDDPVTTADYKSHCAMYSYLSTLFPSMTVISEEHSVGCDSQLATDVNIFDTTILEQIDIRYDVAVDVEDITVWIDPLDATKEFTENLLEYVTTMVCVAIKGVPMIGVIHKPFEPQQTYWAWVHHGVSNNLMNLLKPKSNDPPVLIVSRSHAGKVHNISKTALGDDVRIISAAGAGYKSLEVAVGNATAYIHVTAIKKWDICAGAAIISSLDGVVTSLSGKPMTDFGSIDAVVLENGLLATISNHKWYLDRFAGSPIAEG
ncbi:putative inositol monophosphatase 3 [Chelonus insularis]|uniref:putative inositol monophosphatase 3 n=1 Tax=Chelonus insularis TaxID=460826 RepID=UPI00158969EC|nr:putative inositol monophosphatase 3 [Chelonus insularis]